MADLRSSLEVTKLAQELGTAPEELSFLTASSPEELRDLRAAVSEALVSRHAELATRLAGLSRLLPVPVTAKIAEHALGPVLSARIAGALEPKDAAKLATHVDRDFLARLSAHVDPRRVAPLVAALPDAVVVDTGQRMLAAGEYVALSRFIAVVDADLALRVVGDATPAQLLQVALYADQPVALEGIVSRLSDEQIAGIVAATDDDTRDAAVAQLSSLSEETRSRVEAALGD